MGGSGAIIPLVYYLFHAPKHEVENQYEVDVRRSIYLFGLARPFSRWGESRIGAFIHGDLQPLQPLWKTGDGKFPFDLALARTKAWQRVERFDELLQSNPSLTLHLLQGLSGAKVQYERNAPQVDHIFPRSKLRDQSFEEKDINSYGNLWILAAGKNQNKSNRHPAEYFKDVDKGVMGGALIPPDMLDYGKFPEFLAQRKQRIAEKAKAILQFPDNSFV